MTDQTGHSATEKRAAASAHVWTRPSGVVINELGLRGCATIVRAENC